MRGRRLGLALVAVLLLVIGMAIGRRTTETAELEARPPVTITAEAPAAETRPPASGAGEHSESASYARTQEGAVAAATAYVKRLTGPGMLDARAVRSTLAAIASAESREALVEAYELAAAQARDRLGVGMTSESAVVLRAAPVGYRVDGFHGDVATVSIWRVGIVGSANTVEPRQSWRTETVSLVWERDTWKIEAVRSTPGPTPPLAGPPASPPADLLTTVPTFNEFARELP